MTEFVVERLRSQNFDARSVYAIAPAKVIANANLGVASQVNRHSSELQASAAEKKGAPSTIPPASFFEHLELTPQYIPLADSLRGQGYRYFAQFTAMDIQAIAPGYGLVVVFSFPNLRLIDLSADKVVWINNLSHSEPYQLGGELRKLEENGMRRTKEGMKASMSKLDFSAMWGVVPVATTK